MSSSDEMTEKTKDDIDPGTYLKISKLVETIYNLMDETVDELGNDFGPLANALADLERAAARVEVQL